MELTHWNSQERVTTLIDFFSRYADFTDKKVLDIGCNTGHFSQAALDLKAAHVIGIDYRLKFVNMTNENTDNRCETILTDIFRYTIPAVDIILCCGVIYHTERQFELLKKMKNSGAETVFLEGLVTRNKKCQLDLMNRNTHFAWVPSESYYRALIDFVGFKVISTMTENNRITFALKSS